MAAGPLALTVTAPRTTIAQATPTSKSAAVQQAAVADPAKLPGGA
ncbi:hypothetical protein ACFWWA_31265 [Streptomyces goshikiensis]